VSLVRSASQQRRKCKNFRVFSHQTKHSIRHLSRHILKIKKQLKQKLGAKSSITWRHCYYSPSNSKSRVGNISMWMMTPSFLFGKRTSRESRWLTARAATLNLKVLSRWISASFVPMQTAVTVLRGCSRSTTTAKKAREPEVRYACCATASSYWIRSSLSHWKA
jgi:hypothetical protein